MKATIGDILDIMEFLAPLSLAESWDNSGLQIGHRQKEVRKVWVALDPSMPVIKKACDNHVDLLITHHPLIFNPIRSIDLNSPMGNIMSLAIKNDLSIFSAHTNLDSARSGINDVLATKIGLRNVTALDMADNVKGKETDENIGMGRIGWLDEKADLFQFGEKIKSKLGLKVIRVVGDKNLMVEKAVVCCGSGSSLLGHFFASTAQVFVSGDLKYHDARDAEMLGRGLIDIGHYASEHIILDVLVEQIKKMVNDRKIDVCVNACDIESDPFITV